MKRSSVLLKMERCGFGKPVGKDGCRQLATDYSTIPFLVLPPPQKPAALSQPVNVATSKQESYQLPFTTWNYRPPYLPPHLQIEVASDTHAIEPMIAVIPFGGRPDALPTDRAQPLNHGCGAREITHAKIYLPSNQPLSAAASAIQAAGFVTFAVGDEYLAEVEFDRGIQGQMADFRPQLPLRLRW